MGHRASKSRRRGRTDTPARRARARRKRRPRKDLATRANIERNQSKVKSSTQTLQVAQKPKVDTNMMRLQPDATPTVEGPDVSKANLRRVEEIKTVEKVGSTIAQITEPFAKIFSGITAGFNIALRGPTQGKIGTLIASTIGIKEEASAAQQVGIGSAILREVNSKTDRETREWITGIVAGGVVGGGALGGLASGISPSVVAGSTVAAIGSYPFAGFIKEEALQTLSFGVNTATKNEDWEGVNNALALTNEILNPSVERSIQDGVPYLNVLNALKDFYESARIKMAIDSKYATDMQFKIENGLTDADMRRKAQEEQTAMIEANQIRQIERQKEFRQWSIDAENNDMREDARFWAKRAEEERELARLDRIAIMEFWMEYRKLVWKMQDEQRPSKLNFGIV